MHTFNKHIKSKAAWFNLYVYLKANSTLKAKWNPGNYFILYIEKIIFKSFVSYQGIDINHRHKQKGEKDMS